MNKVIVAVDPGAEGFITLYNGKEYKSYEMPKKQVPTGKKTKTGKPIVKYVFNPYGMIELMLTIRKEYRGAEFMPIIEDVHALFGSSAGSTFNFGKTVGIQTMALHLLSEEVVEVAPKKWQSVMWKGFEVVKKPSGSGKTMVNDTKETSIRIAKHLFPEIDLRRTDRCKVEDDNKVDSLLICEYARRKFYDKKN